MVLRLRALVAAQTIPEKPNWYFSASSIHVPPVVMTHSTPSVPTLGRSRSHSIDHPHDFLEQFLRPLDFGHMKDDVAATAHDVGIDLHNFFSRRLFSDHLLDRSGRASVR